jgi:hypothetical protein
MEKVFTGRDGYMHFRGNEMLKVTAFTLQANMDLLETTSLRDTSKQYTPGHASYTGTATVIYYRSNADVGNNPSVQLMRELLRTTGPSGPTETARLQLFFDYPTQTARQVELTAWITSVSIGASVGEVSTAQIAFTAQGNLTTVTL